MSLVWMKIDTCNYKWYKCLSLKNLHEFGYTLHKSHCTKDVVQTNLPKVGMIYIFWSAIMSNFTWAMPYRLISVGPIIFEKTISL